MVHSALQYTNKEQIPEQIQKVTVSYDEIDVPSYQERLDMSTTTLVVRQEKYN